MPDSRDCSATGPTPLSGRVKKDRRNNLSTSLPESLAVLEASAGRLWSSFDRITNYVRDIEAFLDDRHIFVRSRLPIAAHESYPNAALSVGFAHVGSKGASRYCLFLDPPAVASDGQPHPRIVFGSVKGEVKFLMVDAIADLVALMIADADTLTSQAEEVIDRAVVRFPVPSGRTGKF